MSCRAPNSGTVCGGGSPTGAQLGYDIQGQLATWQNAPSSPTTTAKYLYDGEGQRVEHQVTSSGTTTTTLYLSNLDEVAITGSTTTNTAYFYANGQRIALAVNGAISYLGDDGLGSATTTLDVSGNAQASALYLPYGGGRYTSGTMPTQRLFTGQVSDAASGLDYYNARYYDPALGQFVSADTYDAGGLNRYAYVDDNPTTRTDQDGHCEPFCGALIGGIVGFVAGAVVGAVPIIQAKLSGQPVTGGMWAQLGTNMVLGAAAGAAVGSGSPGAIISTAMAVAGVAMTDIAASQNGRPLVSMQSTFDQIAVGAAAGWLGGAAGEGIAGIGTEGIQGAASRLMTGMIVQGTIGMGAEGATEVADQMRNIGDGRGFTPNGGAILWAGAVSGFWAGVGGLAGETMAGRQDAKFYSGLAGFGQGLGLDVGSAAAYLNPSGDSSANVSYHHTRGRLW